MDDRKSVAIILQREESDRYKMLKTLFNFFFGDSLRIERHWISEDMLQDSAFYFHIYVDENDVYPFIWNPVDRLPPNILYMKGPIYAYWAMNNNLPVKDRLEIMLEVLATTLLLETPPKEKITSYLRQLNKRR